MVEIITRQCVILLFEVLPKLSWEAALKLLVDRVAGVVATVVLAPRFTATFGSTGVETVAVVEVYAILLASLDDNKYQHRHRDKKCGHRREPVVVHYKTGTK